MPGTWVLSSTDVEKANVLLVVWRLKEQVPGNLPKVVERSTGGALEGYLVFYGWEGPGGIQVQTGSLVQGVPPRVQLPEGAPAGNRGKAYLCHEGKWL